MRSRETIMLMAVVGLVLAAGGFLKFIRDHQRLGIPGVRIVNQPIYLPNGRMAGTQSVPLPERVLNFVSTNYCVSEQEHSWLPNDTTFGRRLYRDPQNQFEGLMSVVVMGTDRGSIHKPQNCMVGQGWRIERSDVVTIPIRGPRPYALRAMRLIGSTAAQNPQGRPVILHSVYVYWFVADGELTPFHGQRMWWMARDLIRDGVLQRWAYVSCFSICAPGEEQSTFQRMRDLLSAAVPQFQLAGGSEMAGAPPMVSVFHRAQP